MPVPFQCAVIAFEASSAVLASVTTALEDVDNVAVTLLGAEPEPPATCDCAIAVVGHRGFERAVATLEAWRSRQPAVAVLSIADAIDASKIRRLLSLGVDDFLCAPFLPWELPVRVRRLLGMMKPTASGRVVDHQLRHFVGTHPSFTSQVAKLPALAGCDASVLIVGETGTGKEVCAQAIHYLSRRASHPWVAVNCGALPTELIENELFGHVRGAYTTAHTGCTGLVHEAEGGSLFLDDVDCLPLSAQAKLLRFAQEREYRAVGSTRLQRADVRVIAASNNRLPQMVARGEFRQDLYFRLNVLGLELPPLRERRSDIPALAQHFMRLFAERHGRRITRIAPRALDRLVAYDWPGNVRELQHAMERAVLLATSASLDEGDIELADGHESTASELSFRAAKRRAVTEFERGYIERVLTSAQGNVTHAALQAGKNRRAFFELMRKHQIAAATFRNREAWSANRHSSK